mmetsp:Transcript_22998/g.42330  ORF Transcript_22998/g.42330 Transcript_22998/m.42330 type:complete len:645 (+) Transcript_22998:80-2014(+)
MEPGGVSGLGFPQQGPGQAASFGAAQSKFMPAPRLAPPMQPNAMPMQADMCGGSPQMGRAALSPNVRMGGGCAGPCSGNMGVGMQPGKGGCMQAGMMGQPQNGMPGGCMRPNMPPGMMQPGCRGQMPQQQLDPNMAQQYNFGTQPGQARFPQQAGPGMVGGCCGQMGGQMGGQMSGQMGGQMGHQMGCMPGMQHGMQGMRGKGANMMPGRGPMGPMAGCGGQSMGCGQHMGAPGQNMHMGCGGCGQQFGARPVGMAGQGFGPMRPGVQHRGMHPGMHPGMQGGLPYKSPPPMPEPGVGINLRPQIHKGGTNPDEFGAKLSQLRKEFAHLDLEIPPDIRTWTLEELEAYFLSGGINRPVSGSRASEQPPPPQEKPEVSKTPSRKRPAEGILEYSVGEALEIQTKLREQFSDAAFQNGLKELQERFPERKSKGHSDRALYFEAFEALTLTVHAKVLPTFGMNPDWNGVREMMSRMTEAMKHPKVKKEQEEINVLMGLPRDAEFAPPAKEEEMFQYRPNADAAVPQYSIPLVMDEDGDEAHEFLVEDPVAGEFRLRGPSALSSDCWFVVLQKPAIVIRAKPDLQSDMVGRKKAGKHIRGQRVLDDKWVQLHGTELVKLGVQEAWVLLVGSEEDGSGNEPLLERVPMP